MPWFQLLAENARTEHDGADWDQEGDEQEVRRARRGEDAEIEDIGKRGR